MAHSSTLRALYRTASRSIPIRKCLKPDSLSRSARSFACSSRQFRTAVPPPISPTPTPKNDRLPLPRALAPRRALLLLRVPVPPRHWPSHLEMSSPLLMRLNTALKSVEVAVNAVYDGTGTVDSFYPPIGQEEAYPADLYWPDGFRNRYDKLDGSMIDQIRKDMERDVGARRLTVDRVNKAPNGKRDLEILVCTHGSRDCRCSDIGGALVDELGKLKDEGEPVKIGEIAHVGGHKYAANAIILPSLDMLSNLSPDDARHLLSFIRSNRPPDHPAWAHWRGRYGLTEIEQEGVWNGTAAAHAEERIAEASTASGEVLSENAEVLLRFKTFEGDVREVKAVEGESLLQVARKHDLPAMEGTCGGNLECATCHLYIPSSAPIPDESEDETDMLGYALSYKEGESRLGCQIKVTRELGEWAERGGVISLPRF